MSESFAGRLLHAGFIQGFPYMESVIPYKDNGASEPVLTQPASAYIINCLATMLPALVWPAPTKPDSLPSSRIATYALVDLLVILGLICVLPNWRQDQIVLTSFCGGLSSAVRDRRSLSVRVGTIVRFSGRPMRTISFTQSLNIT